MLILACPFLCVLGLPTFSRKSVAHDHHALSHCCHPFCLLRQRHHDAPFHSCHHKVGRTVPTWKSRPGWGRCVFWLYHLPQGSFLSSTKRQGLASIPSLESSLLNSSLAGSGLCDCTTLDRHRCQHSSEIPQEAGGHGPCFPGDNLSWGI